MRRDNRGLTLIELIVTVAIIAIFSGVVVNFITIGSTSYQSTSKTTRVQMDAQEVLNEIQNLIIDTNRGVYYAYGTEANVGEEIQNDIDGGAVGSRVLFFCSEEPKSSSSMSSTYMLDVLQWSADEQKLYYMQYQKDGRSSDKPEDTEPAAAAFSMPDSLNVEGDAGEESKNPIQDIIKDIEFGEGDISKKKTVLAEGVTGFHTDIRKVQDNGTIRFQIEVDNSGKDVSTLHTVHMRNTVQVVPIGDVFAPRPAVGDAKIAIIKWPLEMDARTSDVLRCTYENIDETSIRWTLKGEGELSSETGMSVRLFAGDKGKIEVTVSARSLDGGEVAPDTKEISIKKKTEPIMELTPSKEEIYVAAGAKAVDLRTAIHWTQGENNVESTDLTYSSDMPHLRVTDDGKLDVEPEAIYPAHINVTSKTTGATGSLLVHIVRISLDDPGHTHFVGDRKPTFGWQYIVDGEIQQSPNGVSVTVLKDGNSYNYPIPPTEKDVFLQTEISENWEVKVSYELKKETHGYGNVEDSKGFAVKERPSDVQILIGGDADNDVLPASDIKNGSYTCGRYNSWGIQAVMPEGIPHGCEMRWEILAASSPDTKFSNNNTVMSGTDENGNITLKIGKSEKTFTIKVTISHSQLASNKSATKTIRVLHDIEIQTNAEKDEDGTFIFHPGKVYGLNMVYHIGEEEIIATAANSVFDVNWTLNYYGKLENGKYTPYENYTYGVKQTGTFILEKIDGLFFDLWINKSFDFKVEHETSES